MVIFVETHKDHECNVIIADTEKARVSLYTKRAGRQSKPSDFRD